MPGFCRFKPMKPQLFAIGIFADIHTQMYLMPIVVVAAIGIVVMLPSFVYRRAL